MSEEILKRIAALESEVLSLKAMVFKTSALRQAVERIIALWPGPFTARQISEVMRERHPELAATMNHFTLETKIATLAKSGFLIRTFQGRGPQPSIYEVNPTPPESAGRKGNKRNNHHDYESGFRAVVRLALDDLPRHFKLTDLQAWVKEHKPDLNVPQGSWSSTLYKLCEQGELEVVKFAHRGKTLKEYTRTEKRIAPSGAEMGELEQAYAEFRKGVDTTIPDQLTALERQYLEAHPAGEK